MLTVSRDNIEVEFDFEIVGSQINVVEDDGHTSYTFLIKKDSLTSTYFENLVVQVDSLNLTSAFIIKHKLLEPLEFISGHDSYSLKSDNQIVPLFLNDEDQTTSKVVYLCFETFQYSCSGDDWGCNAPVHQPQANCYTYTPQCIYRSNSEQSCGYHDMGEGNVGGGIGNPPGGGSGGSGGGGVKPIPIYTNTNLPPFNEVVDHCESMKNLLDVNKANLLSIDNDLDWHFANDDGRENSYSFKKSASGNYSNPVEIPNSNSNALDIPTGKDNRSYPYSSQ